jgi:DNA-directed RNA polymerase specialized sigma24 family protein
MRRRLHAINLARLSMANTASCPVRRRLRRRPCNFLPRVTDNLVVDPSCEDSWRTERFSQLIALFAAAMRRLCAVYARNTADREDLFQEIFLAVWKALPAFRGEASERTWLYRIAHNVALTWQARDRRYRREPLNGTWIPACDPPDPRRIALIELIALLPPVNRQLVTLWLEGLTMAEIEQVTGMRTGTVAVRLTRIRRQLSDATEVNHG